MAPQQKFAALVRSGGRVTSENDVKHHACGRRHGPRSLHCGQEGLPPVEQLPLMQLPLLQPMEIAVDFYHHSLPTNSAIGANPTLGSPYSNELGHFDTNMLLDFLGDNDNIPAMGELNFEYACQDILQQLETVERTNAALAQQQLPWSPTAPSSLLGSCTPLYDYGSVIPVHLPKWEECSSWPLQQQKVQLPAAGCPRAPNPHPSTTPVSVNLLPPTLVHCQLQCQDVDAEGSGTSCGGGIADTQGRGAPACSHANHVDQLSPWSPTHTSATSASRLTTWQTLSDQLATQAGMASRGLPVTSNADLVVVSRSGSSHSDSSDAHFSSLPGCGSGQVRLVQPLSQDMQEPAVTPIMAEPELWCHEAGDPSGLATMASGASIPAAFISSSASDSWQQSKPAQVLAMQPPSRNGLMMPPAGLESVQMLQSHPQAVNMPQAHQPNMSQATPTYNPPAAATAPEHFGNGSPAVQDSSGLAALLSAWSSSGLLQQLDLSSCRNLTDLAALLRCEQAPPPMQDHNAHAAPDAVASAAGGPQSPSCVTRGHLQAAYTLPPQNAVDAVNSNTGSPRGGLQTAGCTPQAPAQAAYPLPATAELCSAKAPLLPNGQQQAWTAAGIDRPPTPCQQTEVKTGSPRAASASQPRDSGLPATVIAVLPALTLSIVKDEGVGGQPDVKMHVGADWDAECSGQAEVKVERIDDVALAETTDHFHASAQPPVTEKRSLRERRRVQIVEPKEADTDASSDMDDGPDSDGDTQHASPPAHKGQRRQRIVGLDGYKGRIKQEPRHCICDSLTSADLQQMFGVPIDEAARQLGVGMTTLKKRCRLLGITRWPFRKIRSMDRLITGVAHCGPDIIQEVMKAAPKEVTAQLVSYKNKLLEDPGKGMDQGIRSMCQANFKVEYKLRGVKQGRIRKKWALA